MAKKECMHSPKKIVPASLASEKKILAQTNSSTPPPLKSQMVHL